jgi:hypothetical protein
MSHLNCPRCGLSCVYPPERATTIGTHGGYCPRCSASGMDVAMFRSSRPIRIAAAGEAPPEKRGRSHPLRFLRALLG